MKIFAGVTDKKQPKAPPQWLWVFCPAIWKSYKHIYLQVWSNNTSYEPPYFKHTPALKAHSIIRTVKMVANIHNSASSLLQHSSST